MHLLEQNLNITAPWPALVFAYAGSNSIELITTPELNQLNAAQALVDSFTPAFAAFDFQAGTETANWSSIVASGGMARSPEEIRSQRQNMEVRYHGLCSAPCVACRDVFDNVFQRFYTAGMALATVLDASEAVYYSGQQITGYLPQAGGALRDYLNTRKNGKRYAWNGPFVSPNVPASDFGITLTP